MFGMYPYGKLQYILHQLNLDWLVKQVNNNTERIEELEEHGGGGGTTPVITATASVDNHTGTPSVAVTKTGTDEAPNFAFAFKNLKGETGATGASGSDGRDGVDGTNGTSAFASVSKSGNTATITCTDANGTTTATVSDGTNGTNGVDGVTPVITATASVNNATGTPSVTVTKSGTDAAPSYAFAFKNLKGATGGTGPAGTPGSKVYTCTTAPTSSSGSYTFNFNNLKPTPTYDKMPAVGDVVFYNNYFYPIASTIDWTSVTCSGRYQIASAPTPSLSLNDLTDVSTSGATNGQVLGFNGSSWEPVTAGGGGGLTTHTLNPMQDFELDSDTYDSATSISWAPGYQPVVLRRTSSMPATGSAQVAYVPSLSSGRGIAMIYSNMNRDMYPAYWVSMGSYIEIYFMNGQIEAGDYVYIV